MNFAVECSTHLKTLVQSIAGLETKTFIVYDQADLSAKIAAGKLPAAGISYEGIRGAMANQTGVSGELVCSVLLMCEAPKLIPSVSTRASSLELIDDVRKAIMGTRSPTGHFWQFVLEAPYALVKDQVVWLQRWNTKVQVISTPS
jgi:hypothetical protein